MLELAWPESSALLASLPLASARPLASASFPFSTSLTTIDGSLTSVEFVARGTATAESATGYSRHLTKVALGLRGGDLQIVFENKLN